MSDSVAEMSKDEFRELIEAVVEQKLIELLGDPDDGQELRAIVEARLDQQRQAVASGERGRYVDEIASELGLE